MIAEGAYYGMQTFDQALLKLYQEGKISMDEALKAATHPHDFKLLVAAEGQRSTSVEQIYSPDNRLPGAPPANGAHDPRRRSGVPAGPTSARLRRLGWPPRRAREAPYFSL